MLGDQLMYDPVTGTQYYASQVSQSGAYYAQAYGPAYQAAAAAAREEAQAQMEQGVPPQQAIANAVAIHNPDATIHPDLANQVLAKSTPVKTTGPDTIPPPAKTNGGFHLDKLYRFFVVSSNPPDGKPFQTGATFPACSRTNTNACAPMGFYNPESMLAYAQKEGSTLIQVSSADEAFNIIEGKQAIDPSKIYTGGALGAGSWTEYLVPAAIGYILWKILF